jgi:predicted AlkP superfamily phosphohydrolase/phosphomutase
MDPEHRKHEPGNRLKDVIRDYYRHVDSLLPRLLEFADDDTTIMVLSDHGAKRLDGGIRINEWLRNEGLLATEREPDGTCSLDDLGVDWARTVAWGEGGYYSRIFMNVRGREPQGIVEPEDYERVRADLAERIAAIPDDEGRPLGTEVFRPEDVYPEAKGVPPDLIVHFGDLYWRAVGTLGGDEGIHTFENDTGPDDANAGPGIEPGVREGMHLLDIAPTVLDILDVPIPASMRGRSLIGRGLPVHEKVEAL